MSRIVDILKDKRIVMPETNALIIKELILKEVIGEDIPGAEFGSENYGRNKEKAELREKVKNL